MTVEQADLVLQVPGFQNALDAAIASHGGDDVPDGSSVVALLPAAAATAHAARAGESAQEHAEHAGAEDEGPERGPHDPHLWHDPMLMADLADAIGQRLGELSPDDAETFTEAAASLRSELEGLDAELAESFGEVEGDKPFITSHAAYTYLAERYDLRQIGIAGVDPETE